MYQALYRKYRPQTFDDVIGQGAVTTTLRNQLMTGKLSHAYLFTGSHGTGKTTCAKIMAKAVNCENPVDGNPCNCCSACRGIDAGNVLDVQEIDAASNNGVDNVRAIRDDAVYPPAEVKKRVYIIDEVHMLSMSAFNALLKTIEEPPEHLMFILATTELNKVPATILSRCQRFSFRRPTAEDITGRINYVAYQEGIHLAPEAAELLGRLADGAFRDGLSLLDQCASATVGQLTVEGVYKTLGLAGQQQTAAMMRAIGQQDAAQTLRIFSELYAEGKDAGAMLNELSTLARDMLMVKTAPNSGLGLISSTCTAQEVRELSPLFTPEELLRMIDLIQTTTGGFKTSMNQRVDGELCLLHLCQPELSDSPKNLSARIARMEEDLTVRILELEMKMKNGEFVARAAIPGEEFEEEAPPPWDDGDIPPLPEEHSDCDNGTKAEPAPCDEAWRRIRDRAAGSVNVQIRSFFEQANGIIRGDVLTIIPSCELGFNMLKKEKGLLEHVRKIAFLELEKEVRVCLGNECVGSSAGDKLQELAQTMQGFDNMIVKN